MNALSGYIELDSGGKTLPFKFGTNCWALFCEMHKIEFFRIGEIVKQNPIAMRDVYYCAHKAAMRSKGQEPMLNLESFGDLLDEDPSVLDKLQNTMLSARMMGFTFKELADKGQKKS